MKRKYLFLAIVGGSALAADQLTKWWAMATLRHGCEELGREGEAAPSIARCHDEELSVDLGGARATEVRFHRGPTTFFTVSCAGGASCLEGAVRLGEDRAGARSTRLERDPMDQALLLLRGVPIEAATLTSGPDGQLYRVVVVTEGGRSSTLRLRYRSPAPDVKVIDNIFHLRYVENPGAAWGFLADAEDGFRGPFFLAISVAAVAFILWVYRRVQRPQRLLASALALVLGGALGNFIDRVRFGYVVDFIDWHYYDKFRWPTFNIADAAITVGVGLLLLDAVRGWIRDRRARKQPEAAP